MRTRKRRLFRRAFFITGITFLLTVGTLGFLTWLLDKPIKVRGDGMIHVPMNATLQDALDSVNAHCDLATPLLVDLKARFMARFRGRTVQSGWYTFTNEDSQKDVLDVLFSGSRRRTVRVTIPEGLTFREIAGIVHRTVETDSAEFVAWCLDSATVHRYAHGAPSIEGYLMPDTYEFYWKADASMVGKRLAEEWQKRMQPLQPTHEDLVLASIVQAEAVVDSEMPRIAGVYKNRLEKGMKLEADPTVQYALGVKRRLHFADLVIASPFNTYHTTGLPPTPINNPGLQAVKAAMQPEDHAFLFFVARGDGTGTHVFAKNGSQHMVNVMNYRRNRGD
jgi:UPF0755 protein